MIDDRSISMCIEIAIVGRNRSRYRRHAIRFGRESTGFLRSPESQTLRITKLRVCVECKDSPLNKSSRVR